MEFEPKLYNPAAQPEEWLIEHFVVRTKVFEQIFADIKTADMSHPQQHYLVQGQRGMGKTTLLLRLKYEMERTPEMKEKLLPVFFNEESYDLASLSNLWEKLLKYFDSNLPGGGQYYKATDKFIGHSDYEQLCYQLVLDILREHNKKIVILFDNFGELFLDNLGEDDSRRFMEVLSTCSELRIIAASAVVLESYNDYSQPFFDFFKIINLAGLNKEETMDLIKKLQEKTNMPFDPEAHRARIETLAVLTGGVIRTIIMLYELLLNDADGTALKDLEGILDKITPLYKHRMEDLKPQQRRIMDVIAKNWDALSTREIAESIRENGQPVPGKIISAQLQELEKNNLVESRKLKSAPKNKLYMVKERFFNIWYLMRHGDKTTQCKVKWLTRYLETLYGVQEGGMEEYIKQYLEKLQSGNYLPSSALTITNALLSSSKVGGVSQALLIEATEGILTQEQIKDLPKVDKEKIISALGFYKKGDFLKASNILESVNPKRLPLISFLALLYFELNKLDDTISYLQDIPQNRRKKTDSFILGLSLYKKGNEKDSLKYFLESLPDLSAGVLPIIGIIYFDLGNYDLAAKYLFEAAEKGLSNEKSQFIYGTVGRIFMNLNRLDDAIRFFEIHLEKNPTDSQAWFNLASVYVNAEKEPEIIEKAMLLAIEYAPLAVNFSQSREQNEKYINLLYAGLRALYIDWKYKKEEALKLVDALPYNERSFDSVFILIWNERFDDASKYLGDANFYERPDDLGKIYVEKFSDVLLLLIAKKQYHSALKIFNESPENLKDKYKPTYYALMQLLKDEYPDEYLKMGSELEEPVRDVLKKIEEYAIDYA